MNASIAVPDSRERNIEVETVTKGITGSAADELLDHSVNT